MGEHSQPTVITEATEWLRRGVEMRTKVEEERQALLERLREIDGILACLPNGARSQASRVTRPARPREASGESVPSLIRRILAEGRGLKAVPVIERVRAIRPTADPRLVHSSLYRMQKDGVVVARGKRGQKIYTLAVQK